MKGSGDAGGLLLLLLVIAFIVAYYIMLAVMFIGFVGFWIALGIGANVMVRYAIGLWGDKHNASPEVARLGLAVIFLAPLVFLTICPMLALFLILLNPMASPALIVMMGIGMPCTSLLSLPAYYWALFAEEIPLLQWKPILPFKTDAAIHAEAKIIGESVRTTLTVICFRLRLYYLEQRSRLTHLKWLNEESNGVVE